MMKTREVERFHMTFKLRRLGTIGTLLIPPLRRFHRLHNFTIPTQSRLSLTDIRNTFHRARGVLGLS